MSSRSHWAVTVLILLLTTAGMRWTDGREAEELARPLDSISTEIAGWRMIESEPLTARTLDLVRPTTYLNREYEKNGVALTLFIAWFSRQSAGEAMHSPKNCFPGSGWDIVEKRSAALPFRGKTVTINRFSIQRSGQTMLVYYWYQSHNRIVANEYRGKALLVRDTILDGKTGGGLVRIIVPNGPEAARSALTFASEVMREMQRCIESGARAAEEKDGKQVRSLGTRSEPEEPAD